MHECLALLPQHSYVMMRHVWDCCYCCWHVVTVSVIGIAISVCMIAVAASVFTNNALLNTHVIVWLYCSALVCICCHIGYLLLHVW